MMSGVIDDLAAHYNGKLPFYVIDPDEDALTAAAASILSIPTTIFYKDGAELGRTVGIREFEYITNIIDNNMI